MTRKEANVEIVRLLLNYINMNPEQRFGQVLMNLKIVQRDNKSGKLVNNFYEEPEKTLERVKETLRGLG
jgi:hypothetical protein